MYIFDFIGLWSVSMKKIRVLGITIVTLIVLLVGAIIAIPISNDIIANKITQNIKEIPLPDNTQYVESFSKAGKLVGNGNGMQYLGGILITSELSLEELQSYYTQHANGEGNCIVEKQTDKNISFIEHGSVSFTTDIDADSYFIVYSWHTDINPFWADLDLRAH